MDDKLAKAAAAIASAKRIVVFSGAGISAESGISTFRAPDIGIWANRVGLAMFGTPFGWWLMPGTAWKMYLQHFRNPIARAQPNDGHRALAALERHWSSNADGDEQLPFMTITQNVDGLHQRAGAREVVEVHGTVYRHVCSRHRHVHPYVLDAAALPEAYDPATDQFFSLEHDYPTCPECHSYLRPDAVLFTESLPESAWRKADRAVQRLVPGRDVMIVVGTSGVVYPAAGLPEYAIERGVTVIEVNPEPTPYSAHVSYYLAGPSGQVLPQLVERAIELRTQATTAAL